MSYNWRIVFATALFALLGLTEAVSAKESYKDEAGRVLYTIDDDGIVSMFENSPTDLTISVTRGTREQMQPQITEISPDAVQAGASAVLRLKGKNLIGATVKFSVPGIEVSAYAGKPKALDLSIHMPATVPPGDVTLEVTTPIGRTEAVFTVKELQIGGIGSAKRESGVAQKLTTAAPTSCPSGMVGVSAERGGFCIEIEQTFSEDFRKAERACAIGGKRLCQVPEWQRACELAVAGKLPLKNMVGDWEWTGTLDRLQNFAAALGALEDFRNVLLGKSDCQARHIVPDWKEEVYSGRCCK